MSFVRVTRSSTAAAAVVETKQSKPSKKPVEPTKPAKTKGDKRLREGKSVAVDDQTAPPAAKKPRLQLR